MKRNTRWKKIFLLILVLQMIASTLLLTSCKGRYWGTNIPGLDICTSFENDDYLIIADYYFIHKRSGEVKVLEHDKGFLIPGRGYVSPSKLYSYQYIFTQSGVEEYTFLETTHYDEQTNETFEQYYPCVITYDYEGKEQSRTYNPEPITEAEAEAFFNNVIPPQETFSFEIDRIYEHHRPEDASPAQQTILAYLENQFEEYDDPICTLVGTAKPMDNVIWFSVATSKTKEFSSAIPLLDSVPFVELMCYDPDANAFEVLFKYDEPETVIVDFDEKGLYIFDVNNNLYYYDFLSKEKTVIYTFPGKVRSFDITGDYLCAYYQNREDYYFVYQKNGTIIANSEFSISLYQFPSPSKNAVPPNSSE